jgi:aldehyde:ferredoxin oxidoreductase
MGKILRINLSKLSLKQEPLAERVARKFLGGRGLAAWFLYNELESGIDPMGPDNKLIFATGPYEGSKIPGSSRYAVFAKSPQTGIWGEAHSAGKFPGIFKASGFDVLIFEGQAKEPVYLWVCEGKAELKDVKDLWGLNTGETEETIKKDLGEPKASVASIGPAGENLVLYACVMNDYHCAAGRTGMGTVMGSKKLKAVAVHGTMSTPIADVDRLKTVRTKIIKDIRQNIKDKGWINRLNKHGTLGGLSTLNEQGILPTKNFQSGVFTGAEKITGKTMTDTILLKNWYCPSCPIGCKRVVEVKTGKYAPVDPKYGGVEYETGGAFGSTCMISDLEAIAKMNQLCNMYGLDTISCGVSVAFAMECYEHGIITLEQTDGLKLDWGKADSAIELIDRIAYRRGIGDILALGVQKAAKKLGRDAKPYAVHVKGLELPMHEPRGKKGLGMSYATSPRGGCHMQTTHDPNLEGKRFMKELGFHQPLSRYSTSRKKVEDVVIGEHYLGTLADSLIICKFTNSGIKSRDLIEGLNAITGWSLNLKQFMTMGERIFNLQRVFNVREGITRKDDRLPKRIGQPLPEGTTKGKRLAPYTLRRMLNDYYDIRGWDRKTGIPKAETLKRLALGFTVKELKK